MNIYITGIAGFLLRHIEKKLIVNEKTPETWAKKNI